VEAAGKVATLGTNVAISLDPCVCDPCNGGWLEATQRAPAAAAQTAAAITTTFSHGNPERAP
jgi:hypothetical protein